MHFGGPDKELDARLGGSMGQRRCRWHTHAVQVGMGMKG